MAAAEGERRASGGRHALHRCHTSIAGRAARPGCSAALCETLTLRRSLEETKVLQSKAGGPAEVAIVY